MYQLSIKVLLIGLSFALAACGFVDLRGIGLTTIPADPYTVLPEKNSPLILYFDTEMQEHETESAVEVISPSGLVEGDFQWQGRALYFIPVSSWLKGIRYVLKISGTVYSRDGRDSYLSREIPFYSGSCVPLPRLESVTPSDGASTEAFIPGEPMLTLRFSLPMDRRTAEAAISCDGMDRNGNIEWSSDNKVMRIFPASTLLPWTVYRWSVSEKALSHEGAPLAAAVSGRFITSQDKFFPEVVRVVPLLMEESRSFQVGSWGEWTQADTDFDNGLFPGHGIGVEFNKPMDEERLCASLEITPSLPGHLEIISPTHVVYVPDRNPEPETQYTLRVSGDIRDSRGLKMGNDFYFMFYSDVPFLRVLSLAFDEDPPGEISNPLGTVVLPVPVNDADSGVMRFTLKFSPPFSREAMEETASRISLSPYFPGTLAQVNLRFMRWLDSDTLRMEWEDLQHGNQETPHYYKLIIPGGAGGVNNGEGSYLKEEIYFYMEALTK